MKRFLIAPIIIVMLLALKSAVPATGEGENGTAVGTKVAGSRERSVPSYPIAPEVSTTLEAMIEPTEPAGPPPMPYQIPEYATYGYGEWQWTDGYPYLKLDPSLQSDDFELSAPDPSAATLLSFFSISDVHITDKESPAQVLYLGYRYPEPRMPNGLPAGNSSCYSGTILYSTQVLDAAVQTINAINKSAPFDFGIALGDAINNTQYNELRWYIDVLDGKTIKPASGAQKGASTIDYQKPYQAAGLDKSIP
jgi:hypothetical protein